MKLILFVFIFFINTWLYANAPEKLWIKVSSTKELYTEYYAAKAGKPTVVLLHGLTNTTHHWSKFINELKKLGYGVVCYDMEGMGQTLLRYAPIRTIIPMTTQIDDLHILLKKLRLKKPYNILGLSYGGGVAFGYSIKHPDYVNNLILMAPYTGPVEKINQFILNQVSTTRTLYPYNPYTDEQLYEYFFRQYVYATYPALEPTVLENPYKLEAVFRLSQGVGSFIPNEHVEKLNVPTTLMIAENDQYFPASEYENFWNTFPVKSRRALIYIKNSEHKIPESQPAQAAKYLQQILE